MGHGYVRGRLDLFDLEYAQVGKANDGNENSGSWSELRCRGSDLPAMIWLNIRQTDTPPGSARSTPKPMIRRVNTSITTMTQWLRRSIDSQRNKSTLHRLSFTCPIKLSQDGPSVPASGR